MKNEKISGFFEENRFLSNMYPCKIEYDNIKYKSSERFYVVMKFKKNQTIEIETLEGYKKKNLREYISEMKNGKECKLFGRNNFKLWRKDWNKIKLKVMEYRVREKFTKNDVLREKLLNTKDKTLIEENTWGDKFWGVCDGEGENNLGKILMKIRKEIQLKEKLDLNNKEEYNLLFQ